MPSFKRGEKVEVIVQKTGRNACRLATDVSNPKQHAKDHGNYWLSSEIIDDPSYYNPSDDTYQVKDNCGLYNGVYFWAKAAYIRRPGGDHDGISCVHCSEFYHMAEPNFEGSKLVCFSCVDSNGWKYQKDKVTKIVTLKK